MTFSFNGIASRREYAYTLVIILAAETLVSVFFSWTAPKLAGPAVLTLNALAIGTLMAYAINILAICAQFTVTVRRLRGLGKNLLLVLLLMIPIVNLVFALALIFGPESETPDELSRAEEIDKKIIDEELKRQAAEATKGENVVDTEAKDVKGGDNK